MLFSLHQVLSAPSWCISIHSCSIWSVGAGHQDIEGAFNGGDVLIRVHELPHVSSAEVRSPHVEDLDGVGGGVTAGRLACSAGKGGELSILRAGRGPPRGRVGDGEGKVVVFGLVNVRQDGASSSSPSESGVCVPEGCSSGGAWWSWRVR